MTTPPLSPSGSSTLLTDNAEQQPVNQDTHQQDTVVVVPRPVVKQLVGLVATCNDGARLEKCLTSLADVCDRIVVVDHASTDATLAIAEQFGAEVVVSPNVLPSVFNRANASAKQGIGSFDAPMAWQAGMDSIRAHQAAFTHGGDGADEASTSELVEHWVLWVNPYEQLTEQSINELELWKKTKLARDDKAPVGLRCQIMPVYGGKRLRHGQLIRHELRLACVDAVRVIDHPYFEGLECPAGRVGFLSGVTFLAEPYTTVQELIAGVAKLSARANRHALEASGKWPSANIITKLFAPAWAFAKQYWVRGSWLDGNAGLVMSKAQALAVFFRQEEALTD
jgi:hypothetical protein